ncbi:MAG TPA: cytochrome c [Terriglobales bacterium]|nr:cytochrome c [Terriglobales bacterium]
MAAPTNNWCFVRAHPIGLMLTTTSKGAGLKVTYLFILACLIGTISAAEEAAPALVSNPLYQKNCAKCHGKTAKGRRMGGPALISGKVSDASVDNLRSIITNGKGRMPKFSEKLAPAEIGQLIMQIKAANQK